jgi:hypothetical protein
MKKYMGMEAGIYWLSVIQSTLHGMHLEITLSVQFKTNAAGTEKNK